MDRPTEENLIRNKLADLQGVADLEFNLMQRTLTVNHTREALPDVISAIESLGL